ncbi:hypothetical protein J0S82_012727 [Galemys pyrenaicus]|uniref:Uncharacterized protein n=1 Tax=Galemys pyrenaicus TaxID=202257 RepID=A0A8J6AR80_GALPY|nr:hypothetical protein J0S82_012727 [Galemys pyrenaicus]
MRTLDKIFHPNLCNKYFGKKNLSQEIRQRRRRTQELYRASVEKGHTVMIKLEKVSKIPRKEAVCAKLLTKQYILPAGREREAQEARVEKPPGTWKQPKAATGFSRHRDTEEKFKTCVPRSSSEGAESTSSSHPGGFAGKSQSSCSRKPTEWSRTFQVSGFLCPQRYSPHPLKLAERAIQL